MNDPGLADILAPAWFALCWLGYGWYADSRLGMRSLLTTMHAYRQVWMQNMLRRDNRMVDVQIIGNLMRSASFFASTSLFVIGGLLAVLGARADAMAVVQELPFAVRTPPLLWDLKVLLLIVVFVYAFFKFTWAYRHYNYCLILLGSLPLPPEVTDGCRDVAERTARIATSTARHFNRGIRGYYFGLAALGWFIHPLLLVLLTTWVVAVLYRREFRSRLLKTLGTAELAPDPAKEQRPRTPERAKI
jgi:uncharacterized membrane protein